MRVLPKLMGPGFSPAPVTELSDPVAELSDPVAELNAFVQDKLQKVGDRISAFSAAAVKDGQVVWTHVSGFSDYNQSVLATPSTRFMWASVSKMIIAHAVMLLVDWKLLDLDGDVGDHLDFHMRHPSFLEAPITFRMLLTHTSGINDAMEYVVEYGRCAAGDNAMPLGEWLREYLTPKGAFYHRPDTLHGSWFHHRPGENYAYSNEGSSLAAYAVERRARAAGLLTGEENFNDFAHRFIFLPLGVGRGDASYFLKDLYGTGPAELQRPAAYYPAIEGVRPVEEYFVYGWPEYPCTRWLASPTHQAQLLANFMSNGTSPGRPPLLSPEAVAEMRRPQPMKSSSAWAQGLIWYYVRQGGRVLLGHDGCDFGVSTAAFFNPDTNVGYLVATSSDCEDPEAITAIEDMSNMIMDTFEGGAPPVVDPNAHRWDPHEVQPRGRTHGIWGWTKRHLGWPFRDRLPYDPCGPCWWLCTEANGPQ